MVSSSKLFEGAVESLSHSLSQKIKHNNRETFFLIILDSRGRILLLKDNKKKPSWILPGGKPKKNEHPVECMVREIQEELRYKIISDFIVFNHKKQINESKSVVVYRYEAPPEDLPEFKLSSEHSGYGFFSIEEIKQLKLSDKTLHALFYFHNAKL
jgi:ADP-ribose pyrophosphatase YjhB (NUDIX family)